MLGVWLWLGVHQPSTLAWTDTGHQVVALIAWDTLPMKVRYRAAELMIESMFRE